MKNFLTFILLFCFLSSFCQIIKNDSIVHEKLLKLEEQNSNLQIEINEIRKNDSLKVSEIKNLNNSVENAQKIITAQNTYITLYQILFGIIVVLSGLAYFFNVRPLTKRVENSLDKAESASEELKSKIRNFEKSVDTKIENRFEKFEKEQEKKIIEELFKDIESNLPNQRLLAIERFSSIGETIKFNSKKIERLFKVIESPLIKSKEKYIITEQLLQIDNDQIMRFFQLWDNIGVDEIELKNSLIWYYLSKEFTKYLVPVSSFIKNHITPSVEFNRILDMLPSHPKEFFILLNNKDLIDSLEAYSITEIKKHTLESVDTWSNIGITKDKLESSYLFKKE